MSEVNYTIYQLNVMTSRGRIFNSIAEDKINLQYEGYRVTYQGTLKGRFKDPQDVLDKLFVKLNCSHPKNYRGHSLSVSDVVQLSDKYFHCQGCGWKKVELSQEEKFAIRE